MKNYYDGKHGNDAIVDNTFIARLLGPGYGILHLGINILVSWLTYYINYWETPLFNYDI